MKVFLYTSAALMVMLGTTAYAQAPARLPVTKDEPAAGAERVPSQSIETPTSVPLRSSAIRSEQPDQREQAQRENRAQAAEQSREIAEERWRYRFHGGEWWYYGPDNAWRYYRDNRWSSYAPETFSPLPSRYTVGNRGTFRSRMNSAGRPYRGAVGPSPAPENAVLPRPTNVSPSP